MQSMQRKSQPSVFCSGSQKLVELVMFQWCWCFVCDWDMCGSTLLSTIENSFAAITVTSAACCRGVVLLTCTATLS